MVTFFVPLTKLLNNCHLFNNSMNSKVRRKKKEERRKKKEERRRHDEKIIRRAVPFDSLFLQ